MSPLTAYRSHKPQLGQVFAVTNVAPALLKVIEQPSIRLNLMKGCDVVARPRLSGVTVRSLSEVISLVVVANSVL